MRIPTDHKTPVVQNLAQMRRRRQAGRDPADVVPPPVVHVPPVVDPGPFASPRSAPAPRRRPMNKSYVWAMVIFAVIFVYQSLMALSMNIVMIEALENGAWYWSDGEYTFTYLVSQGGDVALYASSAMVGGFAAMLWTAVICAGLICLRSLYRFVSKPTA